MTNSFGARAELEIDGTKYVIFRLEALAAEHEIATLPYSLRVLLENTLRHEGFVTSTADVEAVAGWDERSKPGNEIFFTPARVLLQDFTGVLDGEAEFIGKPFTPQELAHKIRNILEAGGSGDEPKQSASAQRFPLG